MDRYTYTIRWTDTKGYRYSVLATSFIKSQALVKALGLSVEVAHVFEPEVHRVTTPRAKRSTKAARNA